MRFSIVTPTNNSERYLEETIKSVITQEGDFEIQYVIVDNCSADHTLDIVERFQRLISSGEFRSRCRKVALQLFSERDNGMYDAINKGFARTDGEVMAWINSDDIYLPGALSAVARALADVSEVKWIKGITSYINEHSEITDRGQCYLYDQRWIEKGYCGPVFPFIQQDSVFWRRNLWDKAGGCDASLRLAGDYLLWRNFARFQPLYSFPRHLSCFRCSPAQLSLQIEKYWHEALSKCHVPGLTSERLAAWCLRTGLLPQWMKILARRCFLGRERFHALVQEAGGWRSLSERVSDKGSRVVEDRALSAVLQ